MLASRTVHGTMDDRATAFAALLDRGLETHYRLAAVILGQVPPLGAAVGLVVILVGMALVIVNNRGPVVDQAPVD